MPGLLPGAKRIGAEAEHPYSIQSPVAGPPISFLSSLVGIRTLAQGASSEV